MKEKKDWFYMILVLVVLVFSVFVTIKIEKFKANIYAKAVRYEMEKDYE